MVFMSAGEGGFAPGNLSQEMQRNLDDPGALHSVTLFDAVAHSFYANFLDFKSATLVTGVTVAAAVAAPPPVPAPGDVGEAPAEPEPEIEALADRDDSDAEEPEAEETEVEPEEPPPPAPCLVGTVIPTPGNFV